MANEDPAEIPEQIRQNRPFFLVLGLAFALSVGTFLVILSLDTDSKDIERNAPPAISAPDAPQGGSAAPGPATPPASN